MNNFRSILCESVLLKQCDHPNVLTVLGVVLDTDHECGLPFIVLPYMVNGDLKGYLQSKRLDNAATDQLAEVCHAILQHVSSRKCMASINVTGPAKIGHVG